MLEKGIKLNLFLAKYIRNARTATAYVVVFLSTKYNANSRLKTCRALRVICKQLYLKLNRRI